MDHTDTEMTDANTAHHDALDQLVYHLGTCNLTKQQRDKAYYLIRIIRTFLGDRDDVVLTFPPAASGFTSWSLPPPRARAE